MLVDATLPVPASLMRLLAGLAPLFTAPSFRTFCGLACGFLAQTGRRTVCGMLAGTGLARCWSHDRAHRFFSGARWNPEDLGLAVARLVVMLLVPAGEPVVGRSMTPCSEGAGRRCGRRRGFTTVPCRDQRKRGTATTGWSRPSSCGCP